MKTKAKKTTPKSVRVNAGDYVVGLDDKKRWLMQVNQVSGNSVHGTLDHQRAYNPVTAEFTIDQIVAVLGPKPEAGTVFGVRVEPYRQTLVHPDWGNVHWFVDMEKQQKIKLKDSLTRIAHRLKKRGLFKFVELGNLELEIRPPKGKYAGMYHHVRTKDGEYKDRMELRPKPDSQSDYVVAHESGHGVWFQCMTRKQKARWVKLYNNFCKATEHDPALIKKLCSDFIKDEIELKDFRSQLDEGQSILFDLIIDQIKSNHRLSNDHINWLVTQGYAEDLRDMWPEKIEDTDFEIAVSEYGTTKPEELFAEAFAFWLIGTKMSKSVKKLMDKTIQKVAHLDKE